MQIFIRWLACFSFLALIISHYLDNTAMKPAKVGTLGTIVTASTSISAISASPLR